jgi:hypothetical protein
MLAHAATRMSGQRGSFPDMIFLVRPQLDPVFLMY